MSIETTFRTDVIVSGMTCGHCTASVREEVGDHPYGRAFLFLVDELGITGAGPRSTSSPGRAELPDDD